MTLTAAYPGLRPFLALAAGLALLASLVFLAVPVRADPPGNNGTVKIDGEEFDSHPDNEPHPGCIFQVDFYGYDEGADLFASVTFETWPPTGEGQGDVLLEDDEIWIGEDEAGGGTDLDATRTYDLSPFLAGREAHPQQGYHVKLTVHADGSIGADTKHKVFWVECEVTAEETPTPTPTPTPGEEEETPRPTPTEEEETPTPTPTPAEEEETPTPTPTPGEEEETPTPTPAGAVGPGEGTPTPTPVVRGGQLGGAVPDTAVAPIGTQVPAMVLAAMALLSLAVLAYLRLAASERN